MQFSFKYCIEPKDHKSEEEWKAIAVEGAILPKLQTDAKDLLIQSCKREEYHLNIEKLPVCLLMPAHCLIVEIFDLLHIHLSSFPCEMATFGKKYFCYILRGCWYWFLTQNITL